MIVDQWSGRPKVTAILNGAVAGLAGVTPASGYLSAHMALLLGICLGLASQRAPHLIKGRLRIDDALDVSAVHGLTGAIGSLFMCVSPDFVLFCTLFMNDKLELISFEGLLF